MNSKIKPSNHIEDFMSHTIYKKEKLQKEELLSMIREQK